MLNVVIAAGGTGGHLYPAVALAREFLRQEPHARIVFVGTGRDVEAKVLGHEGFELETITARPVMGRGALGAIRGVCALPMGLWQSLRVLRARRAGLVIGIGGYASPPVVSAAFLLGIPRVILEPNAFPGMANRMLGPFANRVFLGFESASRAFRRSTVRVVGSPIRRELFEELAGCAAPNRPHSPVLLIFGGSQGARAVNEAMIHALPHLEHLRGRITIVHQTGDADQAEVRAAYEARGVAAEVEPFLFDMPRRLEAASLVVARAGAMTLAELTVCGRAAILVPLPHAIHDHQARNARVLESAGAAVVIPQAELTGERLAGAIAELIGNPARLDQMGRASRTLGRTDSAEVIVRDCLALVEQAPGARE